MIKRIFNIHIYPFRLHFIEIESKADAPALERVFKQFGIKCEESDKMLDDVQNDRVNGGSVFKNITVPDVLLVINRCTSKRKRFEIIMHELRHVVDFMLGACYVNDGEASAYLTGYMANRLYETINK